MSFAILLYFILLSKAFNCLDRVFLESKLHSLGFQGWITSNLHPSKLFVEIRDVSFYLYEADFRFLILRVFIFFIS